MIVTLAQGQMTQLQRTALALNNLAMVAHLPVSAAWSNYTLGLVAYEWNDLLLAEQQFRQVVQARYEANGRAAVDAHVALTLTLEALGRPADADMMLRQAHVFLVESGLTGALPVIDALALRLAADRGEMVGPLPSLELTEASARIGLRTSFLSSPSLAHARYRLWQGTDETLAEARHILALNRRAAEQLHEMRHLVEIGALEARLLAACGDQSGALQTLQEALELGRPGRFVRSFVDCGPSLLPLLEQLQGRAPNSYLEGLIRAFHSAAETAAREPVALPTSDADRLMALRSTLTNREMDVLLLLEQRLSNQEIGDRLYIEPETVKKHLQKVYAKLGVDNRRSAVAFAQRVGLLG
jgi:LuxR family maltose regulon positive regulatory protein